MNREFHSEVPRHVLPQVVHLFGDLQPLVKRFSESVNWEDFTSTYPDRFDGDNVMQGHWHSRKMVKHPEKPDVLVWKDGSVCSAISGMIWQIRGHFREYKLENDIIVSQSHQMTFLGNIIRLTHYVIDGNGTLVHLVPSAETAHLDQEKKRFHSLFEEDMNHAAKILLRETRRVEIKEKPIVQRDPYMESLKRAEKHYRDFRGKILEFYQNGGSLKDTQNDSARRMALDIIQENCQNVADYWTYIAQILRLDREVESESEKRGLSTSD